MINRVFLAGIRDFKIVDRDVLEVAGFRYRVVGWDVKGRALIVQEILNGASE